MPHLLGRRLSALNLSLALVLLLVAGGGAFVLFGRNEQSSAADATTTTAAVTDVTSTVTASGTAEPSESTDLSFETEGTVSEIDVRIGDKVKEGDRLAVATSETASLKLEAAKSSYYATLDSYNETKDDEDAQGGTTWAAVLQAKVAMQEAQATVNGLYITATMSGTITALNGSVGSSTTLAASGEEATPFLTIAKVSKYIVTGSFSETDVARIKEGTSASMTFNAIADKTFTGKVSSIDLTSSTSDSGVVSYGVDVSLSDPPSNLRQGATATITITTASAKDVLAVPTSAVTTANGASTVTVIKNGKSSSKSVTIGVKGDTYTEIKSGLSEGDTVSLGAASSSGGGGFPGGSFPGGAGGPVVMRDGGGPASSVVGGR